MPPSQDLCPNCGSDKSTQVPGCSYRLNVALTIFLAATIIGAPLAILMYVHLINSDKTARHRKCLYCGHQWFADR